MEKTKKEKILEFYRNKSNWVLTPPPMSKVGKKFGVAKSYVHKIVNGNY